MIKSKKGSIGERFLRLFQVPHIAEIDVDNWREALFYIISACKQQIEIGDDPDPGSMAAFKQLLRRAALNGMQENTDDAVARLMDPACSSDKLMTFIDKLIAGEFIAELDFEELFVGRTGHIRKNA